MAKKHFTAAIALAVLGSSALFAGETTIGVVNFGTCFADSKFGKKEQENFENLRKQMTTLIENTDKELKEIIAKLEDADSLSPKAKEELDAKRLGLEEEMGRYQNQFYQLLQHANYQMMQKVNNNISAAAEKVAKQKKLDYIINREMCYYISSDHDVTAAIVSEMDHEFDMESAKEGKKLSENSEELNRVDEAPHDKAG
jgi:outer membrane protein